ncbi:F-box/kelch-repeat protein [Citrus sinensis]|uniref:F-box/kelch-repeat protein n=1 Tax=Citrus sinensis TaxID=2711 RepID=A0ACB8KMB4_CITSI|nr:F-box/kelch-repeat protein [Citrus sinensis]
MSKSLPAKSMLETLLKLPVKTLTRFKCVSKQWHSVISNPTFVALHAKLSESTNKCYLVQYKEGNYSENNFSLCNRNLVQFDEVKFPINSTQIVSSCSGLVCLLLNTFHSCHFPMFVWNPSTRKYKKIPSHKSFDWEKEQYRSSATASFIWEKEMKGSFASFAITGFGYDHRTSDFKILLIVHAREVASEQFRREYSDIQVYSLKNNCWRRIQPNVPCIPCLSSNSTVHLNGAVHWMAIRKDSDGTNKDIIVSFDFGDETFRYRKLPDCLYNTDHIHRERSIGILEKSIALFVSCHSEDNTAGLGICTVYVMKENIGVEHWINLFTVDLRAQFAWQYLGFGANDEVMLRNDDGELVLYDHKTQEVVQCESSNWVANAVIYTESLVSP